ncbi:MAG: replication initiation protein [Lachnospiraceae bacterium]|nr:replication initiation protein [Lachnospiraceae bacterium]
MNEIVKYDNYMNGLKFTGFTTTDFNFLMLLCSKMRDKDVAEMTISFEELRKKTGYTRTSIQKFRTDLERMNEKLMSVTCKLKTETRTLMFVLFPTFDIDVESQTLTVCVNEKFKFILNELLKNFTRFNLEEFINLDSKYSKSLYRLLKQFKITGKLDITLNDFRNKMDIPASYTNKDVMSKVINPSLKELQKYFIDLQCIAKYARKRGKPVEGYIFIFEPEQPLEAITSVAEKHTPVNKYQQAKPQYKHKQNQFDQFMQRGVSQEELDGLKRELLKH